MPIWTPELTLLRDRLAELYPGPEDAGRLLDRVGLPRHHFVLSGTPQSRWRAILTEAQKLGLVEALADHTGAEYGASGASTKAPEPPAEQRAARRKVLVLYGGDAATHARHELLAWLRGPDHNLDARIVAEEAPHSGGAVDDRVDEMIDWADAAIALVTPDPRTPHGAPNVIDEIGRWRGGRGKGTLCIVRQRGVDPYSNHGGIVYVGFESRVREAFEGIRRFLASLGPRGTSTSDTSRSSAAAVPSRDVTIDDSGDLVLFDTLAVEPAHVVERSDQLVIELPGLDSEHEGITKRILASRGPVSVAFGNTATLVELTHHEFTRAGGKATATITARLTKRPQNVMTEMTVVLEGRRHTPAEIAQARASRILLNDPAPVAERVHHDAFESFLRGTATGAPVLESPIPELLRQIPSDYPHRWQLVRLHMIRSLQLSECAEHVDLLRLTVRNGVLVRVTFRGTRATPYAGQPAAVIEVDGSPRY